MTQSFPPKSFLNLPVSEPRGRIRAHFGLSGQGRQPCDRKGSQHTHEETAAWLTAGEELSLIEDRIRTHRVNGSILELG